ncbi:MAG: hypothetical protein FWF56_05520 [Firmicutes bacterium]|nr:hypothetical protein [Bacillota bacterium]MCL1953154.1 hypothetical protein [Bacillota bacterium]
MSTNSNTPTNLPVPIQTLEKVKVEKENRFAKFWKNTFSNNIVLKLSSIAISTCLWVLYVAFL